MSNVAKVAGAAANTLTTPLNVEEVFSTYLYDGNASTQTITNSIDLAGEGGLVWIKSRSATANNQLFDTTRGATKELISNSTAAEATDADTLTAFNANGFSIGADATVNTNAATYASWTFRKAPKFFDVVTYTGTGSAGLTVSHNLGSAPGCFIVKRTDTSGDSWAVYHRYFGGTHYSPLDSGSSFFGNSTRWNNVDATATEFTVGSSTSVNASGGTYVAYLFAHNDSDGGFGATGDQDIIKCGSYTGNGASTGPTVDLGFEPQWILIANSSTTQYWTIYDSMRGLVHQGDDARLHPNRTDAESTTFGALIDLLPNGFRPAASSNQINQSGNVYVYVAIRRGPMAVPTSATDVFDVGDASETGSTAPEYNSGFPVDFAIKRIMSASQPNYVFDRLREGQSLITNGNNAESAFGAAKFDYMDGYYNGTSTSSSNWSAMWKRAPKYFDVVAYTGDGTTDGSKSIQHNLKVAPELMIIKRRTGTTSNWAVYSQTTGATNSLELNSTAAAAGSSSFGSTSPTSSEFYVAYNSTNKSAESHIAYLFASLAGISKVGSYTGSASAQTIDCGFTAGARFVLIKRTDSTGSWVVWDTNRGIVAGNDPYFILESNTAPTTTNDYIDPHNSGFTLAGGVGFANTSGGSYIFYAIA